MPVDPIHEDGELRTPPFGVLVFPGGTEIGLEIRRALSNLKEVELAGAGSDQDRHGPFAYRRWAALPPVGASGWLQALRQVIERLAIDFVFPGHDDVLLALAEHAADVPAIVVTSPLETCRIARSKRATYERLDGAVPVPRVFPGRADVRRFPVFAKPDRSQGSRGAIVVRDEGELERAVAAGSDLLMEFLPGAEYTVDCFSDREQGLLYARGRPRLRTRAGISMSTQTTRHSRLIQRYARAISDRLAMHGAWFFQLREDEQGDPRLLEVAPRIAGASAVHRVTGVNFPLLSIYEQLRTPLQIAANNIEVRLDRALGNRYAHDLRYTNVYVDLDDTLIVRDAVNTRLVAFLYQCLNAGHRLVLLTRHRRDLAATLAHFRLSGLWDRVVHVRDGEEKADYVDEDDAILIDDSFGERQRAHERLGIATFDSSMVELLVDDRA